MSGSEVTSKRSILENLGLHRPELRAWAMYDWANSAFVTIIITTVFSPYFTKQACQGLTDDKAATLYALITYCAIGISAIISLLLGAIADALGAQLRSLAVLVVVGSLATACMWFIGPGDWMFASVLFVIANIAITCSYVCYNALLPSIASSEEADRVSAGGFAMGYLGGGIALAIVLVLLGVLPDANVAARLGFVLTGGWWLLFSLPVLLRVNEPKPSSKMTAGEAIRGMMRMLLHTLREIVGRPTLALFLVAFILYSDGINTIIRMAALFGENIGVPQETMIIAILLTQIVGVPFAFLFGYLTRFFAAKTLILVGIGVYVVIALVGYTMDSAAEFIALAIMVGTVQGGTQALSRSMYSRMIPEGKSGEYFSVYGIFDRFAGAIGSGLLFLFGWLTGSSRLGVLAVAIMFIVGGCVLWMVKPERQPH